jgi:hypothetical protein
MIAVLVLIVAVAMWVFAGANRGWTKTSVPVKQLDPVTGIEGIEYQSRFVPGIDFLVGALFASGIVIASSLFIRHKTVPKPNAENRIV